MENFTPLSGAVGGVLIGIGALALLFFNERIAGISGIYSGLVKMRPNETLWRFLFVLGLLLGGTIVKVFHPAAFDLQIDKPLLTVVAGGLLVGFGTSYGHGCTSGHGVCGVGRLSIRSIAATAIFMFFGIATATLVYIIFWR